MGLEKEVLHVVIKLPFQRPSNFVEPPPITWTSDMEHQIWKFLTQKRTDWKYLAEKLDVPVSHLVRHAAFMYETQLREIQQQLRLSEVGKPTIPSPPPSNTSNSGIHRHSQSSSSQQVRPAISFSSSSSSSKQQKDSMNDTHELRDSNRTEKNISNRETITMDDHQEERYIKSSTPTTSANIKKQYYSEQQLQSNSNNHDYNNIPNIDPMESSRYSTFNKHRHQRHPHQDSNDNGNNNNSNSDTHYDNSMMLSTISNILPRNIQQNETNDMIPGNKNENENNSDDDMKQSIYNTTADIPYDNNIINKNDNNDSDDAQESDSQHSQIHKKGIGKYENEYKDQQKIENNEKEDLYDDDDDDDRLSHHIEKMRLNLEEPAFLPTRKHDGSSSLLNSLRVSKMAELSSSSSTLHQPISKNQHIPFSSLHLKQQKLHHQLHEMNNNNSNSNNINDNASNDITSFNEKESNQKKNTKRYSNQYIENDIAHALQSSQMDSILQQQQQQKKGKEKVENDDDDIIKNQHHYHDKRNQHDNGNSSDDNGNHVNHIIDIHSDNKSNDDDDNNHDDDNDNDYKQFNNDSSKNKMTFGPNLNRIIPVTHSPPDESSSLKDNNSALNSVGSSYSDISDSSVTQSALEDALLSRLNNGSKMSSLAFSRKYL
ncbi:unnamed protein product [Cunninghamella blakesleeana]